MGTVERHAGIPKRLAHLHSAKSLRVPLHGFGHKRSKATEGLQTLGLSQRLLHCEAFKATVLQRQVRGMGTARMEKTVADGARRSMEAATKGVQIEKERWVECHSRNAVR